MVSATSSCLPFGATPPVSAMLKPTLIGAWAKAALVAASRITTHAASRRSAVVKCITIPFLPTRAFSGRVIIRLQDYARPASPVEGSGLMSMS
jgi:hypothetical protein